MLRKNTGSWITTPSDIGFYLQNAIISGIGYGWINLCGSGTGMYYIDCSTTGQTYIGIFAYDLGAHKYEWSVWNGSVSAQKMALNTTGLTVVGTSTPSSDKRLKFNEKTIN